MVDTQLLAICALTFNNPFDRGIGLFRQNFRRNDELDHGILRPIKCIGAGFTSFERVSWLIFLASDECQVTRPGRQHLPPLAFAACGP